MPESECGYASLNPCMTVSEIIAEPLKVCKVTGILMSWVEAEGRFAEMSTPKNQNQHTAGSKNININLFYFYDRNINIHYSILPMMTAFIIEFKINFIFIINIFAVFKPILKNIFPCDCNNLCKFKLFFII